MYDVLKMYTPVPPASVNKVPPGFRQKFGVLIRYPLGFQILKFLVLIRYPLGGSLRVRLLKGETVDPILTYIFFQSLNKAIKI